MAYRQNAYKITGLEQESVYAKAHGLIYIRWINYTEGYYMITIRKGTKELEIQQKKLDSNISKTDQIKAVQDYNIMMGLLEDPEEEDEEDEGTF